MSSISSGLDPTTKYQRLSTEYVKVRNQLGVLKAALLEEQAKVADMQREMSVRDTKLRKVESERDSLAFRNDQLVKRVETLQDSLDAQVATFSAAKGKKKHKEANLRLVAESSRHQHQALTAAGSPSASDPRTVLEEELERKILENGELHSKIFELETRFDEATSELLQRVEELQRENTQFRNANDKQQQKLGTSNGTTAKTTSKPQTIHSTDQSKSLSNGKKSGSAGGSNSSDCGSATLLAGEHFPIGNGTGDHHHSRPVNSSSRSSDGKPSDSAISLDSVEPTDAAATAEGEGGFGESEEMAAKRKLLEEYYMDRIATLTKSLQHATGRATYYKQECEELIRKSLMDQKDLETWQKKVRDLEDKCALLHETLETTQRNYEEQMRELYEHVADRHQQQEAKVLAQSTANLSHATENGQSRNEQRTATNVGGGGGWFSASIRRRPRPNSTQLN